MYVSFSKDYNINNYNIVLFEWYNNIFQCIFILYYYFYYVFIKIILQLFECLYIIKKKNLILNIILLLQNTFAIYIMIYVKKQNYYSEIQNQSLLNDDDLIARKGNHHLSIILVKYLF